MLIWLMTLLVSDCCDCSSWLSSPIPGGGGGVDGSFFGFCGGGALRGGSVVGGGGGGGGLESAADFLFSVEAAATEG